MGFSKTTFTQLLVSLSLLFAPLAGAADTFEQLVVKADLAMGRTLNISTNGGLSTGSGFLLAGVEGTDDFYYMTNNHVIEGAKALGVRFLRDGRVITYSARIIQADKGLDLAVLRLSPEDGKLLKPNVLPIARRTIKKGEAVAALGYPGSADGKTSGLDDPAFYETTLTQGAVSKISRGSWHENSRKLQIVQHTAAVNTGNSGGPLLDSCGQVVGINTQISVYNPGGVPTNGTFWASSSNAIGRFLDDIEVPYYTQTSDCGATGGSGGNGAIAIGGGGFGGGDIPVYVYVLTVLVGVAGVVAIAFVVVKHSSKPNAGRPEGRERKSRRDGSAGGKTILEAKTSAGDRFSLSSGQLKAGATIGRSSEHAMQIDADQISRSHARLDLRGRALQLTDLGSTNGTFVDGTRLTPNSSVQVNTKSDIRLGNVSLHLGKPA